jgi:hypothetical protein
LFAVGKDPQTMPPGEIDQEAVRMLTDPRYQDVVNRASLLAFANHPRFGYNNPLRSTINS